jgi:hypothetical protein
MKNERLEPRNREQAFSYQFEDDVRVLKALSLIGEKEFKKGLQTLRDHMNAYENISKKK